jgi:predicted HTH transcriptional regulator
MTGKTPDKIIQILTDNPEYTLAEMAEIIGKTSRTVERAVRKLREQGYLRYIGPTKGGHWEVLK